MPCLKKQLGKRSVPEVFGQAHSIDQRAEFVVGFLELGGRVACSHNAGTGLRIEGVVATKETADCDGLIEIAREADKSDAATVDHAVVGLYLINKLHGSHFGRTAEGASRECAGIELEHIGPLGQVCPDTRHHVNHVGVVLYLAQKLDADAPTATEVIAGEVYKHDMLGILFLVAEQRIGKLTVALIIAGATEGAGYRVNIGVATIDLEMSFGRGAKHPEIAKVKIKQIGRRVDRPQGTIDIEFIALKRLREASGEHNLKHIAPHGMADASSHHVHILIVGD